jgi:nitrite reductase (cytochrome c-552)
LKILLNQKIQNKMENESTQKSRKPWVNWALFVGTMGVVFLLGLLASSITQRRAETEYVYKPKVQLTQYEPRNELWGKNFPKEYQSYIQTLDTSFYSKYNGNGAIDMLKADPRLVVLWAGYAFSKDYSQSRGHYYAVQDVWNTLRTGAPKTDQDGPQPSTCWACKSPDVPRMMNQMGVREFYSTQWAALGKEIVNPIGCADCHNVETMNLQISRPALVEAYQRRGKDIKQATHQEMRSLVCAQCHVEYYFDKSDHKSAYLTFPWDKGFGVDSVEAYYDKANFTDWTHALSKAPMLKAQHPDFEVYMTGVHADRGVACADCHMPYKSEGGQKFTDHHIQSPLNNVANSCQVCHREEAEKLVKNVYERQEKILQNRDMLEVILVRAHVEAKLAWDKGAKEEQMKPILQLIRHAQWRWDYAAAGHGNSFHSPVEISRVIATGITKAQDARVNLARLLAQLGHTQEVEYPDISTKEKAQKYIGLDMDKLNAEKKDFRNTVLPQWMKAAKEREDKWGVKMVY